MSHTKHSTCMLIAITWLLAACEGTPTGLQDAMAMRAMTYEPLGPAAGLPIIACPPARPQQVTATIGPEGGELTLGSHSLRIPEGALASPTVVRMTKPAGARLILRVEMEGADREVLDSPARLTIRYDSCARQDLQRRGLRVVRLEGNMLATPVEGMVEQDEDDLTFTLLTRRFSTFAVAY